MSNLEITRRRVIFTTMIGIISEVVNKLTPLLLVRIGQQSLGLSGYGYAQYGFYLVDFCLPLILFGYTLKGILVAKDALKKGDKDTVCRKVGEIILLRFIHFLVVGVGLFIYLVGSRQDPVFYTLVLIALFFNTIELSFLNFALQKLHVLNIATIIGKVLSLVLVVLFVKSPDDKYIFLASILVVNGLVCFVTFVYGLRQFRPKFPALSELVRCFRQNIPHGIYIGIFGLLERMDLMFVEKYLGLEKMGIYAGVYKLYQSLIPLLLLISAVFFAESLILKSSKRVDQVLRITVQTVMVMSFPLAFGIWFVAGDVIEIILGADFIPGTVVLSYLISSLTFMGMIHVLTYQIFIQERLINKFALFNLFFMPFLVWLYGFMADHGGIDQIAVGVLIYKGIYAFGLLVWLSFMRQHLWKDVGFGLLPAIFMASGLYYFHRDLSMVTTVLLGVALYVLGLFIFHIKYLSKILRLMRPAA